MSWELQHGPSLEWYLDLAEEEGLITEALISRPELDEDLFPVWEAFMRLSASRSIGFGTVGAIPMSEVRAYLSLKGINDPEDVEDYIVLISELDLEFLRLRHADRPRHQHRQSGGAAGGQ